MRAVERTESALSQANAQAKQTGRTAAEQGKGREGAQISVGLAENLQAGPGAACLFTVAGRMRP